MSVLPGIIIITLVASVLTGTIISSQCRFGGDNNTMSMSILTRIMITHEDFTCVHGDNYTAPVMSVLTGIIKTAPAMSVLTGNIIPP